MSMMRVAQISRPNGSFEIVERQIPEPSAGTVRIKVHACGVCHSDSFTKEGGFPGMPMNEVYPLERVAEAYDRMMSGKARFRVVLMIGE